MPDVDQLLRDAAAELAAANAEVEQVKRRRDDLIVRARDEGLTLQRIADAAGLTNGRIQHILNRERRQDG